MKDRPDDVVRLERVRKRITGSFRNQPLDVSDSQRRIAMQTARRKVVVAGLALSVLSAYACGAAYRRPITRLNDASAVVIATSRVYFSELNRVERDALIEKLSAEKKRIDLVTIRKAQPFSERQIQERLDALDALAQYGNLLAKLESSDAPTQIHTEFKGLADALKTLETLMGA
jgi:hypothetical protein